MVFLRLLFIPVFIIIFVLGRRARRGRGRENNSNVENNSFVWWPFIFGGDNSSNSNFDSGSARMASGSHHSHHSHHSHDSSSSSGYDGGDGDGGS